jgi:hypothetical protein
VAPAEFVRTLMKYYDPMTYSILFENPPANDIDPALENALANLISSPRSA